MPNGFDHIKTLEDWRELSEEDRELFTFLALKEVGNHLGKTTWKRIFMVGAIGGIVGSIVINSPTLLEIMGIFMGG